MLLSNNMTANFVESLAITPSVQILNTCKDKNQTLQETT